MSKQLLSSISLILLTVQNSALSLVVTESRKTEHVYNGATAVFLCELGKVVVCTILLLYSKAREDLKKEAEREDLTEKEELGLVASNSTNDNFFDTSILSEAVKDVFTLDCIRLLVPALLYVLQNNLQLVAATHLTPTSFQILSQLKIATTACCTVLFLDKPLSSKKQLSIVQLMAGIMLFQYSTSSGRSTASVVASLNSSVQNPFVGMISIALACLISGFASVYTEKIVKKASTSIWASNLQLALCSILPASIVILASLVSSKDIRNPMDNFGFWAWAVVVLNVFGGLLVGMVVKYADSILKSFATSVALILTCAMAVLFLGAQMSLLSTAAVAIVVGSIINYSKPDVGKSSLVLTSPSESTLPIEGQQNDQYPYYITYLQ